MEVVKILLDDEKNYNVKEIIENFRKYFSISYDKVFDTLFYPQIIAEKTVAEHVENSQKNQPGNRQIPHKNNPTDIETIINDRTFYYKYLSQKLAILANKGRGYVFILEYIANLESIFKEDDFYEGLLKELDIDHFGKNMRGIELKKILEPIINIVYEMNIIMEQVNNIKGYTNPRLSFETKEEAIADLYASDIFIYCDDNLERPDTRIKKSTLHYKKQKKRQ